MMSAEEVPNQLDVPLSALIELAIESWRLDAWLARIPPDKAASKLRHIARRFQKFLQERELTTLDLTNQKYEPGIAVEVLEAFADESLREHERLIVEMIEPIVLWRGRVVKHGQVVVRQGKAAETKPLKF